MPKIERKIKINSLPLAERTQQQRCACISGAVPQNRGKCRKVRRGQGLKCKFHCQTETVLSSQAYSFQSYRWSLLEVLFFVWRPSDVPSSIYY